MVAGLALLWDDWISAAEPETAPTNGRLNAEKAASFKAARRFRDSFCGVPGQLMRFGLWLAAAPRGILARLYRDRTRRPRPGGTGFQWVDSRDSRSRGPRAIISSGRSGWRLPLQ